MEIEITIPRKYNAAYLSCNLGPRFWEDAEVNGEWDDADNPKMPCAAWDSYERALRWQILIDIETGCIMHWPQGTTARVHYKVCDDGTYILLGQNAEELLQVDGYVLKCMYPNAEGWGDYVIMNIDETGHIDGWKFGKEDVEEMLSYTS